MINTIKAISFFCLITLTSSVSSNEVTKDDWVNSMATVLPTVFCNSSQYFRQCFSITEQECEETAASTTRICINKSIDKIPEILKQPKDGTHWGTIIGSCAGKAFEMSLIKKLINSTKCKNPANWQ